MIIEFQPPCCMQGHQPLDQVAQSHIQPGLECLQGWGIHTLLGQPVQCVTTLCVEKLLPKSIPKVSLWKHSFTNSWSDNSYARPPQICLPFSHTRATDFLRNGVWGSWREAMLSVRFQEAISTYMKITQVPILNPCLSFFI